MYKSSFAESLRTIMPQFQPRETSKIVSFFVSLLPKFAAIFNEMKQQTVFYSKRDLLRMLAMAEWSNEND